MADAAAHSGRTAGCVVRVANAGSKLLTGRPRTVRGGDPVRWRIGAAVAALIGVVAGVLAVGCGGDTGRPVAAVRPATSTIDASGCAEAVAGDPERVDISGFAYCPSVLTVVVGTDVAWANADLSPHTATLGGPDDPFESGLLAQGQAWSRRFDRAGTYRYYCRLHPGMSGTIVVT